VLEQTLGFKTQELTAAKEEMKMKQKRFEEMRSALNREIKALQASLEAQEVAHKQAIAKQDKEAGLQLKYFELKLKEAGEQRDSAFEKSSDLSIKLLDVEAELERAKKDSSILAAQVAAKERQMEHQGRLQKSEVASILMSCEEERNSEIEILKRGHSVEI